MRTENLAQIVHSFFVDYLTIQKGLRPSSIQSYRDVLKLFLCYVAQRIGRKITRLGLPDLAFPHVQGFLRDLEQERGNHVRTRNHRLAVLHTFFEYVAQRAPEMLSIGQQVAAIPMKRTPPPETHFLEREDVETLFHGLPSGHRHARRDRALLLFLYNTGARAQEVADVCVAHLELGPNPRVRLHGKGGKWRPCPLWHETAEALRLLLDVRTPPATPGCPVFIAQSGRALTRFGIYKVVRRHASRLEEDPARSLGFRISPHTFRHTAAVHLLESGAEVNVIRGWLGHASLDTTHRYAEINVKAKEAALRVCEPELGVTDNAPRRAVWKEDERLLAWLDSL